MHTPTHGSSITFRTPVADGRDVYWLPPNNPTRNMTDTQEKIRALFLSALMVFSVFAGTVAFSGAAAAAANEGVAIDKATHYVDSSGTAELEVVLNNSDAAFNSSSEIVVALDNGTNETFSGNDVTNATVANEGVRLTVNKTGGVYRNIDNVSVNGISTGAGNPSTGALTDEFTLAPVGIDVSDGSGDDADAFAGTNVALLVDPSGSQTADIEGPDFDSTRGPNAPSNVFVFDTDDLSTGEYTFNATGVDDTNDPDATLELNDLGLEFQDVSATDIYRDEDVDIEVTTTTAGRDVTVEVMNSDDEVEGTISARIDNSGEADVDDVFNQTTGQPIDAGNYTINVTDDNSGVEIASDTIVVSERPDATVGFTADEFADQRGDVVEINVTLSQTDSANVTLGSDDSGYNVSMTVNDNDGDGNVLVGFNTYLSSSDAPANGTNAFAAITDDDDDDPDNVTNVNVTNSVPRVVADTTYDLEVDAPGAEDPGVSAVVVEPRAQGSVATWVAPNDNTSVVEDLDAVSGAIGSAITQSGEVANGDQVVIQLAETQGLEGLLNATNESSATSQFTSATNSTSLALDFVETSAGPNNQPDTFNITANANVTGVVADKVNDTYYVVVDSDNLDTSEYEVALSLTAGSDNYGLVQDENETINNTIEKVDTTLDVTQPNVTATDDATVEGETNLAPGTELRVRLRTTGNPDQRFIESTTVAVDSDGTFVGEFPLADAAPGDEYDISISRNPSLSGDLTTTFGGTVQEAQETPTDTPTVTDTPANETDTPANETVTDTPTPTETETDTPTPTETETDSPTPTETDSPTPTETDTETETETETETTTGTSTPGFTAVLGVVALLGAALVALRRQN